MPFFTDLGLKISGEVINFNRNTNRNYLVKKKRSFAQLNKIIHNLITQEKKLFLSPIRVLREFFYACVFLTDDGLCAMQKLSEHEGLGKWYYKPINCWKYPLGISEGCLVLADKQHNPHFPCNRCQTVPAYEGLKEELAFMGNIIGQDILKEIETVA